LDWQTSGVILRRQHGDFQNRDSTIASGNKLGKFIPSVRLPIQICQQAIRYDRLGL